MQHVCHKSGYNYVKRRDHTAMSRLFTGPGIISAQGKYSIFLLEPRTYLRLRRSTPTPQEDYESGFQRPSTTLLPHIVPRYRDQGTFSAPINIEQWLDIRGEQMCDKWKTEVLDAPEKTVYVNKWLARTTLDIIGEGLPVFLLRARCLLMTPYSRLCLQLRCSRSEERPLIEGIQQYIVSLPVY